MVHGVAAGGPGGANGLYITDNDALTNIDGLLNLTELGALSIINNNVLTNLDGLSGLTHLYVEFGQGPLIIKDNDILTNIDGLSNLVQVYSNLFIQNNPDLIRFCGLYNLFLNSGLGGSYNVSGNGSNPTIQDIIDDGPCSSQPNGLVAYYPFNGNANDESGYDNNGTVYGASLTADRFENNNSAYHFNGSDYISLDTTFFNGSTAVTALSYSLWFKVDEMPTTSAYSISTKEGFWRTITLQLNPDGVIHFGGSQPNPQNYFEINSSQDAYKKNLWYYLCITYSNSTLEDVS